MASQLVRHPLNEGFVFGPKDLGEYFNCLGVQVLVFLSYFEVVFDMT